MSEECYNCPKQLIDEMDSKWCVRKCVCGYRLLSCCACRTAAGPSFILDKTCPQCKKRSEEEWKWILSVRDWIKEQSKEQRIQMEKMKFKIKEFEVKEKGWIEETRKNLDEKDKLRLEKYKYNIACSNCGQFVPEKQLFVCDSQTILSIGKDFLSFLSKAICGACTLPHIAEHGYRIQNAQSFAIKLAAAEDSMELEERINCIFGPAWDSTVDKMSNMKDMVGQKMSKDSVKAILGSSTSIDEYNSKYQNLEETLKRIENKVLEMMTTANKYRSDVESQLQKININDGSL